MVGWVPRRMRAAMSRTYETDMFEPLAIGNCTLKAEVSDDRNTRKTSGRTGVNVARGSSRHNVAAPRAMTKMMYQRPRGGRSRSKTRQYTAAGAFDRCQTNVLYKCFRHRHVTNSDSPPPRARP